MPHNVVLPAICPRGPPEWWRVWAHALHLHRYWEWWAVSLCSPWAPLPCTRSAFRELWLIPPDPCFLPSPETREGKNQRTRLSWGRTPSRWSSSCKCRGWKPVRVKRLMELASRADDTCMVYLKENNRPKPHHMQIFHTRVRRTPPKIRQQQHLCWSHCLYCSILQKCITGSKIVSFSPFPSWLVCFSSFVLFTPPSPTTPCNVVLFYPRVTFPFKNFKSFVSSSSSSSSPCPKILHSHFAHYYCLLHFSFNLSFLVPFCGEFLGIIKLAPWPIQRDFSENKSPKFAIFQGKN